MGIQDTTWTLSDQTERIDFHRDKRQTHGSTLRKTAFYLDKNEPIRQATVPMHRAAMLYSTILHSDARR